MEPPTLLIVDDDADMRLYLRGCLGTLGPRGSRVLEAADGLTALRLAAANEPGCDLGRVELPGEEE